MSNFPYIPGLSSLSATTPLPVPQQENEDEALSRKKQYSAPFTQEMYKELGVLANSEDYLTTPEITRRLNETFNADFSTRNVQNHLNRGGGKWGRQGRGWQDYNASKAVLEESRCREEGHRKRTETLNKKKEVTYCALSVIYCQCNTIRNTPLSDWEACDWEDLTVIVNEYLQKKGFNAASVDYVQKRLEEYLQETEIINCMFSSIYSQCDSVRNTSLLDWQAKDWDALKTGMNIYLTGLGCAPLSLFATKTLFRTYLLSKTEKKIQERLFLKLNDYLVEHYLASEEGSFPSNAEIERKIAPYFGLSIPLPEEVRASLFSLVDQMQEDILEKAGTITSKDIFTHKHNGGFLS